MDDIEETLRLLTDPARREVVFALTDAEDDVLGLDQLVEQVANADRDDDAEAVRTRLHHHHLPMLEEAGVVEYDRRSETLRSREPPPVVAALVDSVREVSETHG